VLLRKKATTIRVQNGYAFSYDTKDDSFRAVVSRGRHVPGQANTSFSMALHRIEEVAGCDEDSNLLTGNYPLCAYR